MAQGNTAHEAALGALKAHVKATSALGAISGLLSWDQEVMMPAGAGAQRAEEMAVLSGLHHAHESDPRLGEWLVAIDADALGAADQALVREVSRRFARAQKMPSDLAEQIARVTSLAQGEWTKARKARDFAAFAPRLKEVFALRRAQAEALREEGQTLYEVLLEDYEPGMREAELAALLGELRAGLVPLREEVMAKGLSPQGFTTRFAQEGQMALAAHLAERFGYSFETGRLDLSVHPFSSGSGRDVRITTRVDEADPFNCIYSTIHEAGHAVYEQNIAPELALTPLGQGVSMGVHESQSRIFENQMGRSRAFCGYLFGEMQARFGDFGIATAEAFYRHVNHPQPGFIRTEADELHYNLHVMMRFDLERALLNDDLAVSDLEDAWNARFEADFGLKVDHAAHGVLQDVHWSAGLIGYFPTYSLGNIYAGMLHEALRRDLPDLDAALARGETAEPVAWLLARIHRHGGIMPPADLIRSAVGDAEAPVSAAPLLRYLREKFTAL